MATCRDFLVVLRLPFEFLYLYLYTVIIQLRNVFRIIFPGFPFKLEDEIVLVTGGGNGIGRAICRQLAERQKNLTIIIWDVNEKASAETVLELKSLGLLNVFAFNVDVSNRQQVASSAEKIRQQIGDVSILFNNAGISGNLNEGWLEEPEVIEKVLAINFLSHCWTLREFLPRMIENGRGHVVETCSILGNVPSPSAAAYVASKYAMRGYIESLRHDVRLLPSKPKISFSLVYPNHTVTDMMANVDLNQLRYSFMFKGVSPKCVARKIVNGMLLRQEHIYMSALDHIAVFLINTTPSESAIKFMDLVGVIPFHMKLMK